MAALAWDLELTRRVQAAAYALAEAFGFQQFQLDPAHQSWVPATAGLAADALASLLQDAAVRRAAASGEDGDAAGGQRLDTWAASLSQLHGEYLCELTAWRSKMQLEQPPPPQPAQSPQAASEPCPELGQLCQLLELGLQFLLWSEAANLRHTPHLLLLLAHVMRASQPFQQAFDSLAGGSEAGWAEWLQLPADEGFAGACGRFPDVTRLRRQLLQQLHDACPAAFRALDPSGPSPHVQQQQQQQQDDPSAWAARLDAAGDAAVAAARPQHRRLVELQLASLRRLFVGAAAQRQQGVVLNEVVQPLFHFLAEQIDLAGQQGGEEAALRIAYCDVDEAACSPTAVARCLGALETVRRRLPDGTPRDLWHALRQAMRPPVAPLALALAGGARALPLPLDGGSVTEQGVKPSALSQVSLAPSTRGAAMQGSSDRYPRHASRQIIFANLALLLQRGSDAPGCDSLSSTQQELNRQEALKHMRATCFPALELEPESLTSVLDMARHGANWWAEHLLRHKSFAEVRSLATPFVAFWRVCAAHVCLLAGMMGVAFVSHAQRHRPGWRQLLAAAACSMAAEACMRALRAAAHLRLLCALRPVKRQEPRAKHPRTFRLSPWPRVPRRTVLLRVVQLLLWACWGAVLLAAIIPKVLAAPELALGQRWLHRSNAWLLPLGLHAVLLWGSALACQRPGYVTTWPEALCGLRDWAAAALAPRHRGGGAAAVGVPAPAGGAAPRRRRSRCVAAAECAADPQVDGLFYPASNLAVPDAARSCWNAALWLAVLGLKLVFEYKAVVVPAVTTSLAVLDSNADFLARTFIARARAVPHTASYQLLASTSRLLIVASLMLPLLLLTFVSTNLIFTLLGGLVSAAKSVARGVGAVTSWGQLVNSLPLVLATYQRRCVSRSGLALLLRSHPSASEEQLLLPPFAAGWNALTADLRQRDLLSDRELAHLQFTLLEPEALAPAQRELMQALGLVPVLPATCFMAGVAPELLASCAMSCSPQQAWALQVTWAWLCWLLAATGLATEHQAHCLRGLGSPLQLRRATMAQRQRWQHVLQDLSSLLRLLSSPSAPASSTSLSSLLCPLGRALSTELLGPHASCGGPAPLPPAAINGHTSDEPAATALAELATRWLDAGAVRGDDVLARAGAPGAAPLRTVAAHLLDTLSLHAGDTAPCSEIAVRFMVNFAASLLDPALRTAPGAAIMPSLTTLTPHFDEDTIYALNEEDLLLELAAHAASDPSAPQLCADARRLTGRDKVAFLMAPDGSPTPTMSYLRSVFCAGSHTQWHNFVERIRRLAAQRGIDAGRIPQHITELHFLPGEPLHCLKDELLLWASCRGQLLGRTVTGMMTHRAALATLLEAETPPLGPPGDAEAAAARRELLADLLDAKVSYIISSQIYGECVARAATDLKAAVLVRNMRALMALHPSLKVAFIDKQQLVSAHRLGCDVVINRQASVLLTTQRQHALAAAEGYTATHEAYRVRLPINFESGRGIVLGEGKPENQNHAVIFCHGEALQTIDCNQDGVVAEALKLRNCLAEFLQPGWEQPGGAARPWRPLAHGNTVLVGFREWIFSDDSGALAEFAAAVEKTFGTTLQRLMHDPCACRFHYGHPDVWRRSFVATCGGLSKSNKGLHVSEDVYGGYNAALRGYDIRYVDYISVGKGRDMGFETINLFQAKVAAGNGEQVLSREIRRLGTMMDFGRLMSWWCTGPGFYVTSVATFMLIGASVWSMLLLSFDASFTPPAEVWMLQLGSLSMLVWFLTLSLEVGVTRSVFVLLRQIVQGSLMFFVFVARTNAAGFSNDLLYGGAKYLPTGRSYKLAPTSYRDLYMRFGRSHFYCAAMLLLYCLAIVVAHSLDGAGIGPLLPLWSPLLVVVSLLFAPFWFTPLSFRTSQVLADMAQARAWFLSPAGGWRAWHQEACAPMQRLGPAGVLLAHLLELPTLLLLCAVLARVPERDNPGLPRWATVLVLCGGWLALAAVMWRTRAWAASIALRSQAPRLLGMAASALLGAGVAVSGFASSGNLGAGNAFLVLFSVVLVLRLVALARLNPLLAGGIGRMATAIDGAADVLLAVLLNSLRFLMSAFGAATAVQVQLILNYSYARQMLLDNWLSASSQLPALIGRAFKLSRMHRVLHSRSS